MASTTIPNALRSSTVRAITDWVEILRPLHAFQAAELMLDALSNNRGDNIAQLGAVLHAWAMLAKGEVEIELGWAPGHEADPLLRALYSVGRR